MQAYARVLVDNVRGGNIVTDPAPIMSWINRAADKRELVHHALPRALRDETYATIDMFYSATIMMPEFEAFDLHAAVRASVREDSRKLPPRKN